MLFLFVCQNYAFTQIFHLYIATYELSLLYFQNNNFQYRKNINSNYIVKYRG